MVCVEAVRKRERETSMNTEKLLVNLISHCVRVSAVDKTLRCSEVLQERLGTVGEEEKGRATEGSVLMRTAADLLWTLSGQVEQHEGVGADRIFQVRQLSLLMLVGTSPDLTVLVTRALKTDASFRKAKEIGRAHV